MASQSLFTNTETSVAAVAAAIHKVNEFIGKQMSKTHFRDMLFGFKVLLQAAERKQDESYSTIVSWMRLYLKIQASLNPSDNKLCQQFEKTVVPAVTYVVGCLQHKIVNVTNYHYDLLAMIHELLSNSQLSTLESLARLDSGVIACLWFPIDYVGDFNTQMMALRLLVMLLKCVENEQLNRELERIRYLQITPGFKEKLSATIAVSNYHAAKFENMTRDFLNNYNMNKAENVLVYSFRCKTLHFGENIEFFKTVNADKFWIDLNYFPRTLTFNGRFRLNSHRPFETTSVSIIVANMRMNNKTLMVYFQSPAKLSKKWNSSDEFESITYAKFELPTEEVLRFEENHLVLEYYNDSSANQIEVNDAEESPKAQRTTGDTGTELNELPQGNTTFLAQSTAMEIGLNVQRPLSAAQTSTNPREHNFQNSYGFLVGKSSESESNALSGELSQKPKVGIKETVNFKKPSLPKYEKAVRKTATRAIQKPRLRNTKSKKVPIVSESSSSESPKSSRQLSKEMKGVKREAHPIRELRITRRIFKTTRKSMDEDEDSNKENQNKVQNLWKAPRKTKRQPRASKEFDCPSKGKKINKVKPMAYYPQSTQTSASSSQELQVDIVNITNFLNSGNESVATYNAAQQRTVLENVQRPNLENTAAILNRNSQPPVLENNVNSSNRTAQDTDHQPQEEPPTKNNNNAVLENDDPQDQTQDRQSVNCNGTTVVEIFSDLDTSDAEPGQSYRNFTTRSLSRQARSIKKPQRIRRTKQKKSAQKNESTESGESEEPSTSRAAAKRLRRKRSRSGGSLKCDPFDSLKNKDAKCSRFVPNKKVANDLTVYSAEIEIDSTAAALEPIASKAINSTKATTISARNIFNIGNELKKSLFQKSVAPTNAVFLTQSNSSHLKALPQKSGTVEKNEDAADIQECRQSLIEDAYMQYLPDIPACALPEPDTMNISDHEDTAERITNAQAESVATYVATSANFMRKLKQTDCGDKLELPSEIVATKPLLSRNIDEAGNDLKFFDEQNECVLYRKRSEYGSEDSEEDNNSEDGSRTQHATMAAITGHQFTATSLITTTTRHAHLISEGMLIRRAASPARVMRLDSFVEQRQELTIQNNTSLADISNISKDSISMMLGSGNQDVSNLYDTFKHDISSELATLQSENGQRADMLIKKICDISRRIIVEVEKEREEFEQLKLDLARILQQLNWQYDAFHEKAEQFQRFKQNTDILLRTLAEINMKAEINEEFKNTVEKLSEASVNMCTHQWRNFVKESTDALLQNISNVSDL